MLWTSLRMQYRMEPKIREIVSNLSYGGKLIDGPCISDPKQMRPSEIPCRVLEIFPELLASPVLVYNVDSVEKKVHSSYNLRAL